MTRAILAGMLVLLVTAAQARDLQPTDRVLALTQGLRLTALIGAYEPGHGWVANDTFYDAPTQGTPFTLYGLTGRLAQVHSTQEYKMPKHGLPWAWSVAISSYPYSVQDENLAIRGTWPESPRVARLLPTDNPQAVQAVAAYLKSRKVDVPAPRITQALQADLAGDGKTETMIIAQSDKSNPDEKDAVVLYSVALVCHGDRTQALYSYVHLKPAGRSVDEQNRLYGDRPQLAWVTFTDIDGDGKLEIVLRQVFEYTPHIKIYSFDGQHIKKQLESYTIEDP